MERDGDIVTGQGGYRKRKGHPRELSDFKKQSKMLHTLSQIRALLTTSPHKFIKESI